MAVVAIAIALISSALRKLFKRFLNHKMKIFDFNIFLTSLVFAPLFRCFGDYSRTSPADIQGELPQKSPINEPNQFLDVIASVEQWTLRYFLYHHRNVRSFRAFNYLTGDDDAEKSKRSTSKLCTPPSPLPSLFSGRVQFDY